MAVNKTLRSNYKKYQKSSNTSAKRRSFFRSFMPEMVFRTTKLEGEPVTWKMVKAVFSHKSLT